METIELLELRPQISQETERRIKQSIQDCKAKCEAVESELGQAENRLGLLQHNSAGLHDTALILLARADQIRRVSSLRSSWCKAKSAYDDALLALDRLRFMRLRYKELINGS